MSQTPPAVPPSSVRDDRGGLPPDSPAEVEVVDRRGFLQRLGVATLRGTIAAIVAIPGVAYLLDPLRARGKDAGGSSLLAKFGELVEGVPRSFLVRKARRDAWVRYPSLPVGTVWLIRQPKGSPTPVVAFTARCPHAGCPIDLSSDGKRFECPCHKSSFTLSGTPENAIPPRPMDTLEVDPFDASDPNADVRVVFRAFRTKEAEKIADA